MRVLFWYCERLSWKPTIKTLPDVPDGKPGQVERAVVAFIHVEPEDEEKAGKVETKLVKNMKWLAGKWETESMLLHSFTHLAPDRADPEFARELIQRARIRLEEVGFSVLESPYGHFLDLELNAPGHPLARIFKQF